MKLDNVKWDYPVNNQSKGSILLVHGTAPMNIEGNIPGCNPNYKLGNSSLYKALAKVLNDGGWSTLRYTRPGVYNDSVNWDEYINVDHHVIVEQLKKLLESMPTDKPRIIFCWSGGSIHVPHLPLEEVEGVVILGGLCTNRFHNALVSSKDSKIWDEIYQDVEAFEKLEYEEVIKINKPNEDGPLIRFWQESKLKDNWNYFKKYTDIPMLVLHGENDNEVAHIQSKLWKQLLPYHPITVVEKSNANHFLGNEKETGVNIVGNEILKWLDKNVL